MGPVAGGKFIADANDYADRVNVLLETTFYFAAKFY